ncbi:IS200/IS605 family transposase [Streptosporangium sp. NBC_01810]|uniref:IS200/IS605 family transposase n=1 Tax=Streptosporangium sp. NBC_01810 TaxID=2975951 RepID=UPI002DDA2BFF|nr:IS200/IS605 family transposase [Streptosporangium sp. NBC_01810]WSA27849.1 IS200/IS605 family transposase [Streptosporangium sp. NBC_01810]
MSPRREPNPDIRRGRTLVCTLCAHVVFTPGYRRGPFTDEILRRCEDVMRAVRADFETEPVEFNGERDHVHLLVRYPPKVSLSRLVGSLSRLVGSLKGVSARRSRQQYPDHIGKYLWGAHFRSPSYFAARCGGAPLSIIKEYIESQKRSG